MSVSEAGTWPLAGVIVIVVMIKKMINARTERKRRRCPSQPAVGSGIFQLSCFLIAISANAG